MQVETPHGGFQTPTFMPVGTRAYVNYMTPRDLKEAGSQIILGGNTYHMLLQPGMEIIEANGGMHQFMGWDGPMLTDSGGYQVFSLSRNGKLCKIKEDGAHFKHPITGQKIHMTPKMSIETQKVIGADIIMAFDECTAEEGGREKAIEAMHRTHRWLLESKEFHSQNSHSVYGFHQALFGIIQGGSHFDLREKSAQFILELELEGIAIGGEVIGYDMPKTIEIIRHLQPMLPENKVRYTMGVGLGPQDLIDVVREGIDIFDCVAPSRNARHGALYQGSLFEQDDWFTFKNEAGHDRLLIKKSLYAKDETPIMDDCSCYTCQHFCKGYLHFLYKTDAIAYIHLATIHNIHVMQNVCQKMRERILDFT